MKLPFFNIFNGYAPEIGARTVPVTLTFTAAISSVEIDLLTENADGNIAGIQSVWVYNALNAQPLTIVDPVTQFRLAVPSFSVGMYPFVGGMPVRFIASIPTPAAISIPINLLNVPQPYISYPVS